MLVIYLEAESKVLKVREQDFVKRRQFQSWPITYTFMIPIINHSTQTKQFMYNTLQAESAMKLIMPAKVANDGDKWFTKSLLQAVRHERLDYEVQLVRPTWNTVNFREC